MNMQICFVLFGQHSQQGHFSNQNTKNIYYIKEAKVKNLSLSYSYSELLSCSWMLKQKRIFLFPHTCVNVSLEAYYYHSHMQTSPSQLLPSLPPASLCPALSLPSPLSPSPSSLSAQPLSLSRNFSPSLSLSPLWVGDCGSWGSDLQVVGGGYISCWDILFYCIIYDLRCWVYCNESY